MGFVHIWRRLDASAADWGGGCIYPSCPGDQKLLFYCVTTNLSSCNGLSCSWCCDSSEHSSGAGYTTIDLCGTAQTRYVVLSTSILPGIYASCLLPWLSHTARYPDVPDLQVFARVSPDQKELVLRTLRAAGWTTLMCGDGTNDVGALKAAHVGVALLPPSEAQLKAQKEREEQFKQRQKDIAARKAALRSGVRPPPLIPDGPATAPSNAQLVAAGPSAKGVVSPAGPGMPFTEQQN